MNLSIIIVNYNTKNLLIDCLESIKKQSKDLEYEIIVIDNASTDGSIEYLNNQKLKIIINKQNLGFAKANNQGIKISNGDYVLFLNSDTYLTEDCLSFMVGWMEKNLRVGVATCKLLNPNKSVQENGGYFPSLTRVFLWSCLLDDIPGFDKLLSSYHPKINYFQKEHEQDWVKGAFMLVRRKVLEEIGGLDEKIFMYGEDVEFCYRVKNAGWKIVYVPQAKIVHIGGASGVVENTILREYQGLMYFYKKYKSKTSLVVLSVLLKLGAFLRIILFTLLRKDEMRKVYIKALYV